eukprot:12830810-Alexandrium_andersonii.AAC.1
MLAVSQKLQGFDFTITQQLNNLGHRISALEARGPGAQSMSTCGSPGTSGQPPAPNAASTEGSWRQTWSQQEWEAWRNGSWRRAEFSAASAGPGWNYRSNAGATPTPVQAGGWHASAGGPIVPTGGGQSVFAGVPISQPPLDPLRDPWKGARWGEGWGEPFHGQNRPQDYSVDFRMRFDAYAALDLEAQPQ